MSFNKGAARCFNCSGVKLLRANSRIAVSPRIGQEGAAIGLLVLAMVKGLARREGEISNISNNVTEGRIRMKGHYSNIRGRIGRARDGLLETGGECIVWGVDGTIVRSGLRRGDLSKFKPLVLSFPGLDALEEIGDGPRFVTVGPNRLLVFVTASEFVVGVGGGDGDGVITPSRHWSKA